jgi:hypothetical protein
MRRRKRLKPLKQWICDECRHLIRSPKEGWVEWLIDGSSRKYKGFRIVHYQSYSPRLPRGSCHKYIDLHRKGLIEDDVDYMYLTNFTDRGPMSVLLTLLEAGPFGKEQSSQPTVADVREWTEFARRLTIPHYEQARLYMDQAARDGLFKGCYKAEVYYPANLKKIIETYANRD